MRAPVLMVVALLASNAPAATVMTTQAPSHVTIEGSSNLSSWRCRSTAIEARMEIQADLAEINARIDRIAAGEVVTRHDHPQPRFSLTVPVASMHCGNRLMERDMVRALRGREHPSISFAFREIAGTITHEDLGDRYRTTVAGDLLVAGARRSVTIEIEGWRLAPDRFYIRARVPMRMTDFGVKPPTALFGLIRARDEILAQFELRMQAFPGGAQ